MPTKVILIRHGETDWNRRRIYCGFTDVALSASGKKQARRLSAKMRAQQVHKVYSSDRKRAVETAKIIFRGMRIEKIPALREMHFGCFEGLKHDDILSKYRAVYSRWLDDPFSVRIPGGESLAGFGKRVVRGISRIIRRNKDKTVAIVCHGGAISIFINSVLKSRDFWKHIPGSTAVTVLEYGGKKPKILILNDTAHLSGVKG